MEKMEKWTGIIAVLCGWVVLLIGFVMLFLKNNDVKAALFIYKS